MHERDDFAETLICKRRDPANIASRMVCNIRPDRLHNENIREPFGDQASADPTGICFVLQ